MNLLWGLVVIATFCGLYGVYRAVTNSLDFQRSEKKQNKAAWTATPSGRLPLGRPRRSPRFHWICAANLPQVLQNSHDLTLFRIRSRASDPDLDEYLPGEASITIDQLEESLAWTPSGSTVIIYQALQSDPEVMQSLSRMHPCREAFVVEDLISSDILKFAEIRGSLCSK